MKKNIIIIILIAIIALGGFWVWKNQNKKTENQENSQVKQDNKIKEPEEIAKEFLKRHLDRLNKRSSSNELSDNELSLDLVTNNFINNFNKLEKPLFYDPFICAQDYPEDINNTSIILIEKNNTWISFDVKIDKDWVGEGFKMELIKDKNNWKIDKIICDRSGGVF